MAYVYETVQLPDTYILDPNAGWNAGAISIGMLDGDAIYKFQVDGTPVGVVTGLSDPSANTGYSYQEIQWGFYISNGGYRIMESGVDKTAPVISAPTSTVYKIVRIGSEITYYVDEVLVYTSLIAPPSDTSFLLIDSSLYAGGDNIADAVIYNVYKLAATFKMAPTVVVSPMTVTNTLATAIPMSFTMASHGTVDGVHHLGGAFPASLSVAGTANKRRSFSGAFSTATSMTGTMSPLHNDGATVSLQPLDTWATNYPAAVSHSTFETLISESNGGFVAPVISSSTASLVGLVSKGHVLTGEIGTGASDLLALDTISADHNYGESSTSLFGFTSRGGEYVAVDGVFQHTLPVADFRMSAAAYPADLQGVVADIPLVTLAAFSGNGAKLKAPATVLTASATVPSLARVKASVPASSITASGLVGGVAQVDQSISFNVSLVSYSGGYARLALPKSSITASATVGAVATTTIAAPLVSLTATVTPGVYGSAILAVPAVTSLFGIAQLGVPAIAIKASIFQLPSGYTAYAMNIANSAISKYVSYQFDHLVRFNGVYYGVLNNTLFSLEGETDNGIEINAKAELAPTDFNSSQLKRVPYAYVAGRANQTISVEPKADEVSGGAHIAVAIDRVGTHTRRVVLPRGARGRYWGLSISNTAGDALDIEAVEYKVEALSRKV